jgi:hypothetical protein
MNLDDIRIADNVLRVYYQCRKNNKIIGTDEVEKQLNLNKAQLDETLVYLEAEYYIEISNKGYGTGPIYEITKRGFAFFSKTTIEQSLVKNEQPPHPGIINNFHGNFEHSNIVAGTGNSQVINEQAKEPWYKEYLKEIFIGFILLLVSYFVYYFGWR